MYKTKRIILKNPETLNKLEQILSKHKEFKVTKHAFSLDIMFNPNDEHILIGVYKKMI